MSKHKPCLVQLVFDQNQFDKINYVQNQTHIKFEMINWIS